MFVDCLHVCRGPDERCRKAEASVSSRAYQMLNGKRQPVSRNGTMTASMFRTFTTCVAALFVTTMLVTVATSPVGGLI
jgi:hypothetical protein